MNELIEAAKAVLYRWDSPKQKDYLDLGEYMTKLSAAVEQAEKPPTDYNEWTAQNSGKTVSAYEVWTAAQQSERERCAVLCERLPYGTGLAGKTYAEAIRGFGYGASIKLSLEKIDE